MKNLIEYAYDKEDIIQMLKRVGVKEGMTLLVHSSLKNFHHLIDGAEMFVEALIEAVGYEGTIVMPLQNSQNTEPSRWGYPPIDFSLIKKVRENRKAFDPKTSDIVRMGKLVEAFRRHEDVYFTNHPSCSFIAYGKYAKYICASQPNDFSLAEGSPLHRLYDIKSYSLLINVDYDNSTIIHLAESLTGVRPIQIDTATVKEDGQEKVTKLLEYALDSDDGFIEIGKALEEKNQVRILKKDDITLKLYRNDSIVNEGINYFKKYLNYYE